MPMLAPTVTGSGAPIVQGAEMLADTQEFLVEPDAVGQPGQRHRGRQERYSAARRVSGRWCRDTVAKGRCTYRP